MAVQLQIRDGDPWWMSPDIWVVPGNDPNGAPGQPIVGQDNYLWGASSQQRVHGSGSGARRVLLVEPRNRGAAEQLESGRLWLR